MNPTYYITGNIEYVSMVFNGIAAMWNENGAFIWSLVATISILGLLVARFQQIFDPKQDAIKFWILGVMMFVMLLPPNNAPWANPITVTIENVATGEGEVVANVPLLPALAGSIGSSALTFLIEDVSVVFAPITNAADLNPYRHLVKLTEIRGGEVAVNLCNKQGHSIESCEFLETFRKYLDSCYYAVGNVSNVGSAVRPTTIIEGELVSLMESLRVTNYNFYTTTYLGATRTLSCPEAHDEISTFVNGIGFGAVLKDLEIDELEVERAVQAIDPLAGYTGLQVARSFFLLDLYQEWVTTKLEHASSGAMFDALHQRRFQMASDRDLWMTSAQHLIGFLEGLIIFLTPIMAVLLVIPQYGTKIIPKMFGLILWVNLWPFVMVLINLYTGITINNTLDSPDLMKAGMFAGTINDVADELAMAGKLVTLVPMLAAFIMYGGIHGLQGVARAAAPDTKIDTNKVAPDVMGGLHGGGGRYGDSAVMMLGGGEFAVGRNPLPMGMDMGGGLSTGTSMKASTSNQLQKASQELSSTQHAVNEQWSHVRGAALSAGNTTSVGNYLDQGFTKSDSASLNALGQTVNKMTQEQRDELAAKLGFDGKSGIKALAGKAGGALSALVSGGDISTKALTQAGVSASTAEQFSQQYNEQYQSNLLEAERYSKVHNDQLSANRTNARTDGAALLQNYTTSKSNLEAATEAALTEVNASINSNMTAVELAQNLFGIKGEQVLDALKANGLVSDAFRMDDHGNLNEHLQAVAALEKHNASPLQAPSADASPEENARHEEAQAAWAAQQQKLQDRVDVTNLGVDGAPASAAYQQAERLRQSFNFGLENTTGQLTPEMQGSAAWGVALRDMYQDIQKGNIELLSSDGRGGEGSDYSAGVRAMGEALKDIGDNSKNRTGIEQLGHALVRSAELTDEIQQQANKPSEVSTEAKTEQAARADKIDRDRDAVTSLALQSEKAALNGENQVYQAHEGGKARLEQASAQLEQRFADRSLATAQRVEAANDNLIAYSLSDDHYGANGYKGNETVPLAVQAANVEAATNAAYPTAALSHFNSDQPLSLPEQQLTVAAIAGALTHGNPDVAPNFDQLQNHTNPALAGADKERWQGAMNLLNEHLSGPSSQWSDSQKALYAHASLVAEGQSSLEYAGLMSEMLRGDVPGPELLMSNPASAGAVALMDDVAERYQQLYGEDFYRAVENGDKWRQATETINGNSPKTMAALDDLRMLSASSGQSVPLTPVAQAQLSAGYANAGETSAGLAVSAGMAILGHDASDVGAFSPHLPTYWGAHQPDALKFENLEDFQSRFTDAYDTAVEHNNHTALERYAEVPGHLMAMGEAMVAAGRTADGERLMGAASEMAGHIDPVKHSQEAGAPVGGGSGSPGRHGPDLTPLDPSKPANQ